MKSLLQLSFVSLLLFIQLTAKAQSGMVVDSFSYSFTTAGPAGLAYDGSGFWISGSGAGYIYKVDTSGAIVDSVIDPANAVSDITEGIIFAGNYLWTTCYTCDSIYRINLSNGQTTSFPGAIPDDRISLAYDGSSTLFFAMGSDAAGAFKFDINTHLISPWNEAATARGLIYLNGSLFGTDMAFFPTTSYIFKIDTATGDLLHQQPWCVNDGFGGMGMTYDGQFVYQAKYNDNKIYKIKVLFPSSNIRHVTENGAGDNSGNDWQNAISGKQLKSSLMTAAREFDYWIAAGTYHADSIDRLATFTVREGVGVYGGFNGTEDSISQRNTTTNVTILDGDIGIPNDTSDNSYRIVTFDHVSDQTILDGFTLMNAHNTNPAGFPNARGGAVYIDGVSLSRSSPIISNCIFENNYSTSGAAIYSNASYNGRVAEHITNCRFENNISDIADGGAYRAANLNGGTIESEFSNCTFENNGALQTGIGTSGGAIFIGTQNYGNGKIKVKIAECDFKGNMATAGGGAVALINDGNVSDSLSVEYCKFIGNSAKVDGSALWNDKGSGTGTTFINVNHCIFSANIGDSVSGGGGAFTSRAQAGGNTNTVVDNCLFAGNVSNNGAAIYLFSDQANNSMTISNSTIAGNKAVQGGGILAWHYGIDPFETHLAVKNSIIWGNSSSYEVFPDTVNNEAPTLTLENSDIEGNFSGINVINIDPQFISAVDFNNAPDSSGDYHLQTNSPCINTGNNSSVISVTDLDNYMRIYNNFVDMGCYEFASVPLSIESISENNNCKIYPVPSVSDIKIEANITNGLISIYNQLGNRMYMGEFNSIHELDINLFPEGIYYVIIKNSNKYVRGIFVK